MKLMMIFALTSEIGIGFSFYRVLFHYRFMLG